MGIQVEAFDFANISATTAAFAAQGGRYGITVHATFGGGSVTLQILAFDNTTWLTAATPIVADGTALVDLPPGQYRFAVATATGVYVTLAGVPT